jgi:hypothetical protein
MVTRPVPALAPIAPVRRWAVNITPAERVGRIVLGGLAAIAGVALLASASSILAIVLEVLLVAAGVDLVVTGAVGHCPLYQKLGFVPESLRRQRSVDEPRSDSHACCS